MAKLVSKSGTKSVVWDFFGLELRKDGKPVDDGSAICRSCRKRVLAKHGNTSNLLAHFRTCHWKNGPGNFGPAGPKLRREIRSGRTKITGRNGPRLGLLVRLSFKSIVRCK